VRSRRLKVLLDKPASAQTTADRATKAIKAAELIFADEMGATLGLARQNVGLITKTPPFDPSHCGVSRTIRTRSTLGGARLSLVERVLWEQVRRTGAGW
jgi:hypothetical protein